MRTTATSISITESPPELNGTQTRIASFLSTRLNIEIPSPDTDLIATGALDSLAFVELILHLEHEHGVRIPMEEMEIEQFKTVARISEFVGRNRALR